MYQKIYSPRVLATSSSLVGQDSLSHHVDRSIGVYIIDRYAYYIQQYLDGQVKSLESNASMAEYMMACGPAQCISTVGGWFIVILNWRKMMCLSPNRFVWKAVGEGARDRLFRWHKASNVMPYWLIYGIIFFRYTKGIDEAIYSDADMEFILSQK